MLKPKVLLGHIQFFSLNHVTDKKTKTRMLWSLQYTAISSKGVSRSSPYSIQSSFWNVNWQSFSCVWLFATLWTVAGQVPLSMEFSRQEYWSGQPFPSPGDIPDSGIKLGSPSLKPDSVPSEPPGVQSICCEGWEADRPDAWSQKSEGESWSRVGGETRPVKGTSLSEAVDFSSREVEVSFGGEEM